jgi:hypothetical protein
MRKRVGEVEKERRTRGALNKVDGLVRIPLCQSIELNGLFNDLRIAHENTWRKVVAVRDAKIFIETAIRG